MKCIAIDVNNRPNEVPVSRWIKQGQEYTIVKVMKMMNQGIYGVKLEELNNDDLFPWSYFGLYRFGILVPEIEELIATGELELEMI